MKRVLPALALCCLAFATHARTLAEIKERGAIGLCAHPNSLPFASKTAEPPGFGTTARFPPGPVLSTARRRPRSSTVRSGVQTGLPDLRDLNSQPTLS